MTDTLYADVSEFQRCAVDDSYPYRVIAIRSNDGGHIDEKWQANYAWCKRRCDQGGLVFFIVYFVWRPDWRTGVDRLRQLVGDPHRRMAVMIDVESWGGQISGDHSDGINDAYNEIAGWLGDSRRVIGYGNTGDLNSIWPHRPAGLRVVLAAYGSNPDFPGKVAHQFTDGKGYGAESGLPDGCPPFEDPANPRTRHCMDAADGLSPEEFAAACGIEVAVQPAPGTGVFTDTDRDLLRRIKTRVDAARGDKLVSRSPFRALGEGPQHSIFDFELDTDASIHVLLIEKLARYGDPDALHRLQEIGQANPAAYPDRSSHIVLAKLFLQGLTRPDNGGSDPRPEGPHRLYTVSGNWTKPDIGFTADVARGVDQGLFSWHPVDCAAVISAQQAPTYAEAVQHGVDELTQRIKSQGGTFALCGYSQGAEVVSRVLVELQSGALTARMADFIGAAVFGNPMRQLGRLFPGDTDPGGRGIAAITLTDSPDTWAEYVNPGDLYAAVEDTDAGACLTEMYQAAMKLGIADTTVPANPLLGAVAGGGGIVEKLRRLMSPGGNLDSQLKAIDAAVEFLRADPPTQPHTAYDQMECLPNTTISSVEHAVSWLNQLGRAAVDVGGSGGA
jgi:hypothetical protein